MDSIKLETCDLMLDMAETHALPKLLKAPDTLLPIDVAVLAVVFNVVLTPRKDEFAVPDDAEMADPILVAALPAVAAAAAFAWSDD